MEDVDSIFPGGSSLDDTGIAFVALMKLLRDRATCNVHLVCSAKSVTALHPYIRSFFVEEWPFAPAKTHQALAPSDPAPWAALVGIDEEKGRLLRYLDLSLRAVGSLPQAGPSIAPRKGIILVGPLGSGKTALVRALALLRGVALHTLEFASLLSADLGQAEANLRGAFRVSSPAVIFIDDLQALFTARSGETGGTRRMTSQLLLQLDELHDGLFVIGASSVNVNGLDPALVARLGTLSIGKTSVEFSEGDRAKVFADQWKRQATKIASDVDVARLVSHSRHLQLPVLLHLTNTAGLRALMRGSTEICMADFMAAINCPNLSDTPFSVT